MYRFFFGISHIPKFLENSMYRFFFRDIPYTKILEKFHVPFFSRDIPCTIIIEKLYVPFFLGYRDILYLNNFHCTYVPIFVGISYIPKFFEKIIYRIFNFVGISHTYTEFFGKQYVSYFWNYQFSLIQGIR